MNLLPTLLVDKLSNTDVIGFTFFTGYMAMFAASVFFFFERSNVSGKWKTSLLVSGLITMIAAVHYYYMRGYYLEFNESPIAFRYIDWTLTVPLMCVEFYLLTKPYGAKMSLLWKMIGYSVIMLVAGYIGEALLPEQTIIWGVISTIGYIGIVYEVAFGSVKKLAETSNDPTVDTAVKLLRNFVVVGWAIYPIGYMAMEGNLLSGVLEPASMDLIYNIGDAVNKIGFGLVVYYVAVTSSKETVTA
ncbi:MAG: bacteriorhodopsin-like [Bacteroidota bacterium]